MFIFQVACFPFDDHNCPPIQLVISFCHSAYSWLKEDIENVVVVHCKAGKARTGLMISSLLLFLKVKLVALCNNENNTCPKIFTKFLTVGASFLFLL
jgi:protein-tyrosine phosphatase